MLEGPRGAARGPMLLTALPPGIDYEGGAAGGLSCQRDVSVSYPNESTHASSTGLKFRFPTDFVHTRPNWASSSAWSTSWGSMVRAQYRPPLESPALAGFFFGTSGLGSRCTAPVSAGCQRSCPDSTKSSVFDPGHQVVAVALLNSSARRNAECTFTDRRPSRLVVSWSAVSGDFRKRSLLPDILSVLLTRRGPSTRRTYVTPLLGG
jgi:hypothetical protein